MSTWRDGYDSFVEVAGYERFNPFDEPRVRYLQFDLFLLSTEAGNGRLYPHFSQKILGPTRWNETSLRIEAKTTVESRKLVFGMSPKQGP